MSKIINLPKIKDIKNDDILLLDGPDGTKSIRVEDLGRSLVNILSAKELTNGKDFNELPIGDISTEGSFVPTILTSGSYGGTLHKASIDDLAYRLLDEVADIPMRRNTWRGKNLGSEISRSQLGTIANGRFFDLFLGDYWIVNNITWRIVDFDYWMNMGDTQCTQHHLVIMPDTPLDQQPMNTTDTTEGGYYGSTMGQGGVRTAWYILSGVFGSDYILRNREYLTNAVTNGYPSGGAWVDHHPILPNEIMIFGTKICTPYGNGIITPYNFTIDKTQLAGMRINPELINPNLENYWLRDIIDTKRFSFVGRDGTVSYAGASLSMGVRPVFGIIG